MKTLSREAHLLRDYIDELEGTMERLKEDICRLQEQRDALENGNVELYRQLTEPDF